MKAVLHCRLQMFNGNLTSEYVQQKHSSYTVHSAGQLGGIALAGINAPGTLCSKAIVAYSGIPIAVAPLAAAASSVSFLGVCGLHLCV